MDPLIILFGFGVGLLVATTGMGGGSLMTPLLILVFAVKPVVAIGTDLIYGAVTKTVGGWRHFSMGTVHIGTSLWLALGSVLPAATRDTARIVIRKVVDELERRLVSRLQHNRSLETSHRPYRRRRSPGRVG